MTWFDCRHQTLPDQKTFRVRKMLTSIGRARGNDLVLADTSVESTHCSLVRSGDVYTVAPSSPTAEVRVNGRKVRRHKLREGDQVSVGSWSLVFHHGEPAPTPRENADALKLVEQLYKLSANVMGSHDATHLFASLLRGLVDITRAETGFLIVLKDGEQHLAASHDEGGKEAGRAMSDSIVQQVLRTGKALIISDALNDTQFGLARSVVDLRLSSIMCAPLRYGDELLGAIYLGNDRHAHLFTQADLTFLEIYAGQAALLVHHALLLNQLQLDNTELREQLAASQQSRSIGASPSMVEVGRIVARVAPTDLSVLVLGETGTGKELVARELHGLSERRDGPFVAINCGAIPEALLESELFGHRKGSFTGATADKMGKIEASDGGTLFLDEIGEMPMHLQVKLLRVLQERTIERVGDLQPRPVDLRIVAATNRDPEELIDRGAFRRDLFYRLNEVVVQLPPLRDRGEDIELLAQHFLRRFRAQYGGNVRGFSNGALTAMRQHTWPGNVRQLENHVKKAVILSDKVLLCAEDLGLQGSGDEGELLPLAEAQEGFKLQYIRRALELHDWNKAATARALGVDARTIFRYVEKLPASERR